jgi:hypothetical protein
VGSSKTLHEKKPCESGQITSDTSLVFHVKHWALQPVLLSGKGSFTVKMFHVKQRFCIQPIKGQYSIKCAAEKRGCCCWRAHSGFYAAMEPESYGPPSILRIVLQSGTRRGEEILQKQVVLNESRRFLQ